MCVFVLQTVSGATDEYLETLHEVIRAKINLFHKRCRLHSYKSLKKMLLGNMRGGMVRV